MVFSDFDFVLGISYVSVWVPLGIEFLWFSMSSI